MSSDETYRQTILDAVTSPAFRRATFGGAVRGEKTPWVRVVLRAVEIHGQRSVQFSYFDQKKDVTKNYAGAEVAERLDEVLGAKFAGVHVSTRDEEIDLHVSKKGKVLIGRRAAETTTDAAVERHNRIKDVPLPEGRADHVLEAMGVMTRDGHVRPTMRAKFTQINEFLKELGHVVAGERGLKAMGFGSKERPVQILDCGCGSSYLTIAAHHYLNDVLGIPARVLGVDINEEVIQKSIEKGARLGGAGLEFMQGKIGQVEGARPDVVLALHACDTATDDAIAQAIKSGAEVLLSVPCCHHDLNDKIGAGEGDVLRPMVRHGILKQRLADLATDAFRALALRIMGYRTDVIEFVSQEHTGRNLMIRAVKGANVGDREFVEEWKRMKTFFGVEPYLERALGEGFRAMINGN